MTALTEEQQAAAQQFVDLALEALKDERGVHAETAVAGIARMAGTFLFRSFAFPLPSLQPGQAELSDVANEQGPKLMQILGGVLAHIGGELDASRLGVNRDPAHQPQLDFLSTQKRLEPPFSKTMQAFHLSCVQAAESAAMATAFLIKRCVPLLDPNIAFNIALYGFVEGSKTAPAPITPGSDAA